MRTKIRRSVRHNHTLTSDPWPTMVKAIKLFSKLRGSLDMTLHDLLLLILLLSPGLALSALVMGVMAAGG